MNLDLNEQLMHDTKDAHVCIFMANLVTWLRYNASKTHIPIEKRNFYDNRFWSYNSVNDFVKYFGFWSIRNIRTIIKNCIKHDLIVTKNFNKKKYDNTLWYSLTDKGLQYFPILADLFQNTLVRSDKTLVRSDKPIPEDLNLKENNNIISVLENDLSGEDVAKSDYHGNHANEGQDGFNEVESMGVSAKSDYHNNQTKNESLLSKSNQSYLRTYSNPKHSAKSIASSEIIEAYHDVLPDCPKIKVIDSKLANQLNHMQKNWPRYQKEGKPFSIESFKDYLNYIKQHYPWFIKPYTTENGNVRRNNLRILTREINITKIVNGEFSAN